MRCNKIVKRIIQGRREESMTQESSLFRKLKIATEELEGIIE